MGKKGDLSREFVEGEIHTFLEKFADSVSEIRFDSWPLWWFFKMRFLGDKLILPLKNRDEIVRSILRDEELELSKKRKDEIISFALRKFIKYNEKIKIGISKFNKKSSWKGVKGDRVMFVAHTNAITFNNVDFNVDRIGSVVDEVKKDNKLQEYISIIDPVSHNPLLKLLKYENLVYNYIDMGLQKRVREESFRLHKKWIGVKNSLEYTSRIEKRIFNYFQPALDLFFSKEVIYITLLYYETYKKIIKKENIKFLVLYAGDGLTIRCAIAAADKLNINSLQIPHGLGIMDQDWELPESTYYTAIGKEYKKRLVRMGLESSKIFITGPVFMDDIAQYIQNKNLQNKRKKILFATQPCVEDNYLSKEEYFSYIKKYFFDLKKLRDVDIKIKLHPREKYLESYQNIIKNLNFENITIVEGQEKKLLYSLINESDIVICFSSTILVEAMIMSTPIISIDLIRGNDPIIQNRDKIIHINPKEGIYDISKKILYNKKEQKDIIEKQRELVKEYLYKVDGKAGKRVVELIKKLSV